jgi:hypothetical protein
MWSACRQNASVLNASLFWGHTNRLEIAGRFAATDIVSSRGKEARAAVKEMS